MTELSGGEHHMVHRIGWLRAAVLGANDGIVSTASLIVGIAAASASKEPLILAGIAGLVAGAMSMAAGEYVSVSSQSDTEQADIAKEKQALIDEPEVELQELAEIYEGRGIEPKLALEVAVQLTAHDPLGAHMRDELGISHTVKAMPLQAAISSALSFAVGAGLPLIAAIISPLQHIPIMVGATSLFSLALLGVVAAQAGGAGKTKSVVRIVFWGAAAMIITAAVGGWIGAVI